MIKFVCPSCKSTCSVDDKFAKRKLKCPSCSARVLHIDGDRVELLTAGSAVPPKPSATAIAASAAETQPASPSVPASTSASSAPTDLTPLATAVLPHSVTELVDASESKQNFYVGAGLLIFFCVVGVILGFIVSSKVLIVLPVAILLSAIGIYLYLHTQKLKKQIEARQKK